MSYDNVTLEAGLMAISWRSIENRRQFVLPPCSRSVEPGADLTDHPSYSSSNTSVQTGAVSFHSDKLVKRVYIPARDNAIVNRLVKTKVVKEVDHEADRIERLRNEGKSKKAIANDLVSSRRRDAELAGCAFSRVSISPPSLLTSHNQKTSQLETQRMYAKAKADQSYDAMFAELNEAGPASDRRHLDDEGEDEDLEGGDRGGDDDDFW